MGPKPSNQECDSLVSKSVVTFMAKERRLATQGGPLISKKDLRLRSDKGANTTLEKTSVLRMLGTLLEMARPPSIWRSRLQMLPVLPS